MPDTRVLSHLCPSTPLSKRQFQFIKPEPFTSGLVQLTYHRTRKPEFPHWRRLSELRSRKVLDLELFAEAIRNVAVFYDGVAMFGGAFIFGLVESIRPRLRKISEGYP